MIAKRQNACARSAARGETEKPPTKIDYANKKRRLKQKDLSGGRGLFVSEIVVNLLSQAVVMILYYQ